MATIKDVARAAGVSVTTASYSLNGEGRISDGTRLRVKTAAEKLGYAPSLSARALKGQSPRAIGIFVDGIGGPVYGSIIEGAQEKFKYEGWGLIVGTLNGSVQELARSLARESWLAGSIILNGGMAPSELTDSLLSKSPLVIFDIEPEFLLHVPNTSRCVRFETDNKTGMELIFNEIHAKGIGHLLFLEGSSSSWDSNNRKAIIGTLLSDNNLPEPDYSVCNFKAQDAYTCVQDQLQKGHIYDCIVSANDEMAMGAVRALKEAGMRIPEDVMVTGFDGIDSARWIDPPLSTVTVDYHALGFQIGARMLQLINDTDAVSCNVTFPVSFKKRQSTAQGE